MPRRALRSAPRDRAFQILFEIHLACGTARAAALHEPAAVAVEDALPPNAHLDRCLLVSDAAPPVDFPLEEAAAVAARRGGFPPVIHDALGRAFAVEPLVALGRALPAGGASC